MNAPHFILHIIRKLTLLWDPDFTKLTSSERKRLELAESDPSTISHEELMKELDS